MRTGEAGKQRRQSYTILSRASSWAKIAAVLLLAGIWPGDSQAQTAVLNRPVRATTPLPQSVYDDIANEAVTSIVVPYGRYTLPSLITINRSNLVIDFSGSTLYLVPVPTGSWYPFRMFSIIDPFTGGVPTRNASHLTGTITTGTTTLTMDPAEIEDVQPGEVVMIVAGVNTTDPVEPQFYIPATVQSVNSGVITFTEGLGKNITTYANLAALQAVVDPGLHSRTGTWGENFNDENYKKGLGTDHGLLRYVGSFVHDVYIKNLNLNFTLPPDADFRVGMLPFFIRDTLNCGLENISSFNSVGNLVHLWSCYDFTVDNFRYRGEGRSSIGDTTTWCGILFNAWAGDGMTYSDVDVRRARNIELVYTEINAADMSLNNIHFDCEYVDDWTYTSEATVFSLISHVAPLNATNLYLRIRGLVGAYDMFPFTGGMTADGLTVAADSSGDYFMFCDSTFTNGLTIGGINYGPLVIDNEIVTATSGGTRTITLPEGVYKRIRVRKNSGTMTELADGYDVLYALDGSWTESSVIDNGRRMLGAILGQHSVYTAQLWFKCWNVSSEAQVEFDIEYYPKAGGAGWSVN